MSENTAEAASVIAASAVDKLQTQLRDSQSMCGALERENARLRKEMDVTRKVCDSRIQSSDEEIIHYSSKLRRKRERYKCLVKSICDMATCSICLDIYTNPHVILCANECYQNICLRCKENAANAVDRRGEGVPGGRRLTCPSCRKWALAFVPVGNKLRELVKFIPRRCEHCSQTIRTNTNGENVVELMLKHLGECPEYMVPCPNMAHGCMARIKRRCVETHIHTECKTVPCKAFIGFVQRRDIEEPPSPASAHTTSSPSPSPSPAESPRNTIITPRTQHRRLESTVARNRLSTSSAHSVASASSSSSATEAPNNCPRGFHKLGCTFVGTYPRMLRHYSNTCSRKENEKVYKDLRILYGEYREYRVKSIISENDSIMSQQKAAAASLEVGTDASCREIVTVLNERATAAAAAATPNEEMSD